MASNPRETLQLKFAKLGVVDLSDNDSGGLIQDFMSSVANSPSTLEKEFYFIHIPDEFFGLVAQDSNLKASRANVAVGWRGDELLNWEWRNIRSEEGDLAGYINSTGSFFDGENLVGNFELRIDQEGNRKSAFGFLTKGETTFTIRPAPEEILETNAPNSRVHVIFKSTPKDANISDPTGSCVIQTGDEIENTDLEFDFTIAIGFSKAAIAFDNGRELDEKANRFVRQLNDAFAARGLKLRFHLRGLSGEPKGIKTNYVEATPDAHPDGSVTFEGTVKDYRALLLGEDSELKYLRKVQKDVGAHFLVLIVDNDRRGWGNITSRNANDALTVVDIGGDADKYFTFSHEVAHLLNGTHGCSDWAINWQTVMGKRRESASIGAKLRPRRNSFSKRNETGMFNHAVTVTYKISNDNWFN